MGDLRTFNAPYVGQTNFNVPYIVGHTNFIVPKCGIYEILVPHVLDVRIFGARIQGILL